MALTSCRTVEDIYTVCLESINDFNSVNVSTALHRMAKQIKHKPDKSAVSIIESLCNRAMETMKFCGSRGIANMMWALAKLGLSPGSELKAAMFRRATAISGEFDPQNVANLMWALATLSLTPGLELEAAMCRQATAIS